jgi:hypothetical protein
MRFLKNPNFKVTVTHSAVDYDYICDVFPVVRVKRRENNYDTAVLDLADQFWKHYGTDIDALDEIKIYFKDAAESAYTQVFGGYIRKLLPRIGASGQVHQLLCKGYGAALEATHCNRDYGTESANPTYPQPWNIWTNIIADFVEKSFAGAATNWGIDNANISNYCATDIPYINNPYRANVDVVNLVCDLTSAIGAGATAGAHWIVDHNKTVGGKPRFLVGKIGAHAAGAGPVTYWPDWWNGADESNLVQGQDFTDFQINDNSEEFANNVILITDLRKPSYDYWTEKTPFSTYWDKTASITLNDNNVDELVGDYCLDIQCDGGAWGGAWFPKAQDILWDMTAWGSIKSIPALNFYIRKDSQIIGNDTWVALFTTDYDHDYWATTIDLGSDPDGEWIHKSLPVGDYWASDVETRKFRWTDLDAGAPDWAAIKGICFYTHCNAGDDGHLLIDDLHFTGKIIRSAYDSTSISTTVGREYQKILISQVTLDDSAEYGIDTGLAARLAAAELFRRRALPYTVSATLAGIAPTMMAGQKLKVYAGLKLSGTYAINGATMRIMELEHALTAQGGYTTVTATTDLLNSHPISKLDQYATWKENMLVNSKEAKDIRASSEVDLLIPILAYDYG